MFCKKIRTLFAVIIVMLSASGCRSLGPKSISPDRIDYVEQIGESWKKQMLLNIVKLRYLDPPVFLDVTSVISQYGIENQVNVDGRWYWPMPSTSGYEAGVGGYSRYAEKPTITYTPLSGSKFTRNLLTPIPPVAIISLIQSGWPIDMIFSLAVKTVNGVQSPFGARASITAKQESDFIQLTQALRKVQQAGVVDIRLEKNGEKEDMLFAISDSMSNETQQERETIRRILKVNPDINKYKLVLGSVSQSDDQLAMLTRSLLDIMLGVASKVEVPQKDVAENRTLPTVPLSGSEWETRIHSGCNKPQDAFAAVRYQDNWFWIDNKDVQSKRNFALLMILMSLTETEQKSGAPLFTIGG
jgi:hypothetical protein